MDLAKSSAGSVDVAAVIALAGNPNTGKSTVFNRLTGLRQHTGNWPGKTVTNARGCFFYQGKKYMLVDLPGTYSLSANSAEEEVARDFLCFGQPAVTVVVVDATCLERNLNLVLQVLELTRDVVICVNLMDEAARKGIRVDIPRLAGLLGVPVIGTNARKGEGLTQLKEAIKQAVLRKASGGSERAGTGKANRQQHESFWRPIVYDQIIEESIKELMPAVQKCFAGRFNARWLALRLLEEKVDFLQSLGVQSKTRLCHVRELADQLTKVRQSLAAKGCGINELKDCLVAAIVRKAEMIAAKAVVFTQRDYQRFDRRIDHLVTSKKWGIPIMLLLLGGVFWLTILGANYPSELLSAGLFRLEGHLAALFQVAGAPAWLQGVVVSGMFRTMAWVVSVMLPPMAIFFPLFTLLEDFGYLPRVAFNLDYYFKRACAHGKQALTMCMGFGCNAAGVIACRIIDSPRERLIATITNNFVPCNGRFPTLIALTTIFLVVGQGTLRTVWAASCILLVIVLGVLLTLGVSKLLSKTILQGLPSSFTLELPPYRKPQVGRIIIRSVFDRTLFVLARAVLVAAPAGALIWFLANTTIGGTGLLQHLAGFLDPFGRLLGMDGFILLAFFLGLPANEIVIPILIMGYTGAGSLTELNSLTALRELFGQHGWTWVTAVCTMLFMLNHFPCGTTLLTIRQETQSMKWPLVSFLVPTVCGIILCFVVAQGMRFFG